VSGWRHRRAAPAELVPTQRFNLKRDGSLTKLDEPGYSFPPLLAPASVGTRAK